MNILPPPPKKKKKKRGQTQKSCANHQYLHLRTMPTNEQVLFSRNGSVDVSEIHQLSLVAYYSTWKWMVLKMIFLFQGCILRFHVNLPGCMYDGFRYIPGGDCRNITSTNQFDPGTFVSLPLQQQLQHLLHTRHALWPGSHFPNLLVRTLPRYTQQFTKKSQWSRLCNSGICHINLSSAGSQCCEVSSLKDTTSNLVKSTNSAKLQNPGKIAFPPPPRFHGKTVAFHHGACPRPSLFVDVEMPTLFFPKSFGLHTVRAPTFVKWRLAPSLEVLWLEHLTFIFLGWRNKPNTPKKNSK